MTKKPKGKKDPREGTKADKKEDKGKGGEKGEKYGGMGKY